MGTSERELPPVAPEGAALCCLAHQGAECLDYGAAGLSVNEHDLGRGEGGGCDTMTTWIEFLRAWREIRLWERQSLNKDEERRC